MTLTYTRRYSKLLRTTVVLKIGVAPKMQEAGSRVKVSLCLFGMLVYLSR